MRKFKIKDKTGKRIQLYDILIINKNTKNINYVKWHGDELWFKKSNFNKCCENIESLINNHDLFDKYSGKKFHQVYFTDGEILGICWAIYK